jgi:hypothetical protein
MSAEMEAKLAKDRVAREARYERAIELATDGVASAGHDSKARREVLRNHLESLGLSPGEIASRMLLDVSYAAPQAARRSPERDPQAQERNRLELTRELQREREPRVLGD